MSSVDLTKGSTGLRSNGKPRKTKEERGPRKRRKGKRSTKDVQFDSLGQPVALLSGGDDSDSETEQMQSFNSFSDISTLASLMNQQQPDNFDKSKDDIANGNGGMDTFFSWLRGQPPPVSSPLLMPSVASDDYFIAETTHNQWLQLQYEWLLAKNPFAEEDEFLLEQAERKKWSMWAVHASETERQRRIQVLKDLDFEQERERAARRRMANELIERERNERISTQFLSSVSSSHWYNETLSAYSEDYVLACPYYKLGCRVDCKRSTLPKHLLECQYCLEMSSHLNKDKAAVRQQQQKQEYADSSKLSEILEYEVVCPNIIMGCGFSGNRKDLMQHFQECQFRGQTREQEQEERRLLKEMVINECEEERSRRVLDDDAVVENSTTGETIETSNHSTSDNIVASGSSEPTATITNKSIVIPQHHQQKELYVLPPTASTASSTILPGAFIAHNSSYSYSYDSFSDDNMVSSSEDDLGMFHQRRFVSYPIPQGTSGSNNNDNNDNNNNSATSSATVSSKTAHKSQKKSKVHGILQSQHEAILNKMHNEVDIVWKTFQEFYESKTKHIVQSLVSELEIIIRELWPFCKLELFGSIVTGIIGQSSDIDIVIYFSDNFKELLTVRGAIPLLHALASHLESRGKELIQIKNVLLHARIPIIKAESITSIETISFFNNETNLLPVKLSIDISLDGPNHSGLATTHLVTTLLQALPPLGPVALILKLYLKQKGLSDSFTGGLPSYGLIMLLLLPILQHIRIQMTHSLSYLLNSATTATTNGIISSTNNNGIASATGMSSMTSATSGSNSNHSNNIPKYLPYMNHISPVRFFKEQTPRSRSQSELTSMAMYHQHQFYPISSKGTSSAINIAGNNNHESIPVRRKSLPTHATPPTHHQQQQQCHNVSNATTSKSPNTTNALSTWSRSTNQGLSINISRFPDVNVAVAKNSGNGAHHHATAEGINLEGGAVRRKSGGDYRVVASSATSDTTNSTSRRNYQGSAKSVGRIATALHRRSQSGDVATQNIWSAIDQQKEYGRKVAMKILCNDYTDALRSSAVVTPAQQPSYSVVTDIDPSSDLCPATAAAAAAATGTPQSTPTAPESPRPYIDSDCPIYGILLESFLELYSEGLAGGKYGFTMRDGGFRFNLKVANGLPSHPQASDPLLIEDPINVLNNIGKNCYKVAAVQSVFVEALEKLKTIVVRHNSLQRQNLGSTNRQRKSKTNNAVSTVSRGEAVVTKQSYPIVDRAQDNAAALVADDDRISSTKDQFESTAVITASSSSCDSLSLTDSNGITIVVRSDYSSIASQPTGINDPVSANLISDANIKTNISVIEPSLVRTRVKNLVAKIQAAEAMPPPLLSPEKPVEGIEDGVNGGVASSPSPDRSHGKSDLSSNSLGSLTLLKEVFYGKTA